MKGYHEPKWPAIIDRHWKECVASMKRAAHMIGGSDGRSVLCVELGADGRIKEYWSEDFRVSLPVYQEESIIIGMYRNGPDWFQAWADAYDAEAALQLVQGYHADIAMKDAMWRNIGKAEGAINNLYVFGSKFIDPQRAQIMEAAHLVIQAGQILSKMLFNPCTTYHRGFPLNIEPTKETSTPHATGERDAFPSPMLPHM